MKYLICFFFILFISCSSNKNKKLEFALDFAGKNRVELEKVLEHYKNDSLKLKAACFLIENMPQHYSFSIPDADELEQIKIKSEKEDSLSINDLLIIQNIQKKTRNVSKIYDCHVITADYLIENIDLSFQTWKKCPWSKYYSFDDFCKMVLPYRIEHEPLDSWRKKYYDRFLPLLDSLYQGTDIIKACDVLSVVLWNEGSYGEKSLMPFELPSYSASFLLNQRLGGCKESINFAVYVLRALGIPVNQDMIYYYYDLSRIHYWISVKDTTGRLVVSDFDSKGVQRGRNDDDIRPKRKIYRQCYEEQPTCSLEGIRYKGLYKILKNRLIKDVTAEYYGENILSLEIPPIEKEQLVYICAFGRKGWVPQAVVPVKKRKAIFKNMGINQLYFLAFYVADEFKIIGYPFFYDGENIHYYTPNNQLLERIKLRRKAPLVSRIIDHLDNALDITIECADNPSFNPSYILYKITDTVRTNYNIIPFIPNRSFRYICCRAATGKRLEFAELAFYSDEKRERELPYIFMDKYLPASVQNMKDNDPLTYYTSDEEKNFLHLDFLEKVTVKQLMFIPRNDDNFIRIGDVYELLYFNGNEGWNSLGKQIAKENYLFYEVPQNALFWLRNLTRGQEEKLFIYQDNEQKFYL
ncbi:hypothetical protein [Parabacteroides bouchesdurhonensis]|uniref:hypothetical protein n=1 Tax=Parabacteroides bouchesdurhonensis TaxID=1936995 RepID=UPI000C84B58D|nr:hypothetical protein [Parabacteroides bouchesdurhonensis]